MDRSQDHFSETHYQAPLIKGPLKFFNPTKRHIPLPVKTSPTGAVKPVADGIPPAGEIYHIWRSRDNRKGRHAVAVTDGHVNRPGVPRATNNVREVVKGVGRMLFRYPVWDVSYDVAIIFVIGSIVWCINGFFVWYPLYKPSSEFPNESALGGGLTGLIGATIFEFGAALALLEAVNENRTDCFGWALEKVVEEGEVRAHKPQCRHHHGDRTTFLGLDKGQRRGATEEDGIVTEKDGVVGKGDRGKRRWSWWPTGYELRTHYLREIGFLAALIQMLGATIFWIAGIVGMPGILAVLDVPATNGIYWLPQVVGGSGFIISAGLLMLETQSKWWKPNLNSLGWHIGFWNWVGGIGFTLCGALGFGSGNTSVEYAVTLSTFIGSWAFLLGSIIQWYESLDKYPVIVKKSS